MVKFLKRDKQIPVSRGRVDKYTWVDEGSSYVMSDILASSI